MRVFRKMRSLWVYFHQAILSKRNRMRLLLQKDWCIFSSLGRKKQSIFEIVNKQPIKFNKKNHLSLWTWYSMEFAPKYLWNVLWKNHSLWKLFKRQNSKRSLHDHLQIKKDYSSSFVDSIINKRLVASIERIFFLTQSK